MYLKIDEIDSIENLPDYYNFNKPYVIRGGCKSMKIFNTENKLDFFYNKLKKSRTKVELYEKESDMQIGEYYEYTKKPFIESFDHIVNNKKPIHFIADYDLKSSFDFECQQLVHYFNLDIDKKRDINTVFLYFGNNSITATHIHLDYDYLLNQIHGKKIVYMFDYYDNPSLKMTGVFSSTNNFLKDNFFKLDHSKLKVYKVELYPGDTLSIPPWWFHAVKGEDLSLSITKTYHRKDHSFVYKKPYILCTHMINTVGNFADIEEIFIFIILLIILIIYYYY
tara:strand:- start:1736 stop:2575 length:840 start_codon:yes stop_codon:yes gene_type:complete